jgi:hypothetical protein
MDELELVPGPLPLEAGGNSQALTTRKSPTLRRLNVTTSIVEL